MLLTGFWRRHRNDIRALEMAIQDTVRNRFELTVVVSVQLHLLLWPGGLGTRNGSERC